MVILFNLLIIVYIRNFFNEVYECFLFYKGKIKGVFYFFLLDIEDVKKVIEFGFLIGIFGVVIFKKVIEFYEIVEKIDIF